MMSSNGGMQCMSQEMHIDDFSETTILTNEDIAEILSSTKSVFMADDGGFDRNDGINKPVRKRSRASKHTPTTFLIAKASDFRALVQQLTGCQSASSYKGPINLKFGAAEEDERTDMDKDSAFPMLELNFYDHKTQVKNPQEHQIQHLQQHDLEDNQRLYEEQESCSSGGEAFVSAYNSPGPYSTTMDDFCLKNNLMHDSLDNGDYSSEIVADEAIFAGDYSSYYGLADEAILFCGY